jgi:hypothetical protein
MFTKQVSLYGASPQKRQLVFCAGGTEMKKTRAMGSGAGF